MSNTIADVLAPAPYMAIDNQFKRVRFMGESPQLSTAITYLAAMLTYVLEPYRVRALDFAALPANLTLPEGWIFILLWPEGPQVDADPKGTSTTLNSKITTRHTLALNGLLAQASVPVAQIAQPMSDLYDLVRRAVNANVYLPAPSGKEQLTRAMQMSGWSQEILRLGSIDNRPAEWHNCHMKLELTLVHWMSAPGVKLGAT